MQPAQKQPFWQQHGLPAPGTHLSVADYDALPETSIPMEYISGVVIYPHWNEATMSPSPMPKHQDIVLNVATLLKAHAKAHGGKAYVAPLDVYLSDEVRVQPDAFWLAPDSDCERADKFLRGTPDLIVAVLSPSTATRDRTEKFDIYEEHAVREYWIVDPRDALVEVYVYEGDGFNRLGGYGAGSSFTSPTLNQTPINVDAIFED